MLQLWAKNYEEHSGIRFNVLAAGNLLALQRLEQGSAQFAALDDLFVELHFHQLAAFVRITAARENLAIIYWLPHTPELQLSRSALLGLFTGTIKDWNAREIGVANPGIELPAMLVEIATGAGEKTGPARLARWLQTIDPASTYAIGSGETVH